METKHRNYSAAAASGLKYFFLLVVTLAPLLVIRGATLFWTDTLNFKPAQTNGTLVTPAVTQVTYKVYFTTNFLQPVSAWSFAMMTSTNRGTNEITYFVPTGSNATYFTVTALDPLWGIESDFSNVAIKPGGLSPVQTGIRP